jgi:hypothetical protein
MDYDDIGRFSIASGTPDRPRARQDRGAEAAGFTTPKQSYAGTSTFWAVMACFRLALSRTAAFAAVSECWRAIELDPEAVPFREVARRQAPQSAADRAAIRRLTEAVRRSHSSTLREKVCFRKAIAARPTLRQAKSRCPPHPESRTARRHQIAAVYAWAFSYTSSFFNAEAYLSFFLLSKPVFPSLFCRLQVPKDPFAPSK